MQGEEEMNSTDVTLDTKMKTLKMKGVSKLVCSKWDQTMFVGRCKGHGLLP